MFTRPIHVAILDDDPSCRTALTRFLKAQGMVVDTYATGGQFLSRVVVAIAAPIGRRGERILGERGRRRHPRRRTGPPGGLATVAA